MSASHWRPHKRLGENIRYFLEMSSEDDAMIIAGNNYEKYYIDHPRVFYAGHLNWAQLISIYKRSKYFIHLSYLDHCPNVVVDARACGCHIVCSSSGGTKEIAGTDSTVILEDEWDFSPIRLYHPPDMDFSKFKKGESDSEINIENVAETYFKAFNEVLKI